MSLPTTVFYYDQDGKEVFAKCVNVGWSISDTIWTDCVLDLPKFHGAHLVRVYDIIIPAKWVGDEQYRDILLKLYQERNAAYHKRRNIDGRYNRIRSYSQPRHNWEEANKVLIPMIRRTMPSLIAAELVGVQPMTDKAGLIFSIRERYSNYYIIRVVQQWWHKFKHKCNNKLIYLKSLFR